MDIKNSSVFLWDYMYDASKVMDKYLGSVFQTENEALPWVQFELFSSVTFMGVLLIDLYDTYDPGMSEVQIHVGNEPILSKDKTSTNPLCSVSNVDTSRVGQYQDILCQQPLEGRFLLIQRRQKGYLQLTEVMFFHTLPYCK